MSADKQYSLVMDIATGLKEKSEQVAEILRDNVLLKENVIKEKFEESEVIYDDDGERKS